MRLRLVVRTAGTWQGKSILVTRVPFVIGRHPACNLRPTSALISHRHCALLAREEKVYVRDLESTNGTFVNSEKIRGERELHDNDSLRVGPVDFDVRIERTPGVSQPTPLPPARGQVQPANEEEVAAILLSIQDESDSPSFPSPVDSEGVPTGRTVMDMLPPDYAAPPDPEKAKPPSAQPPTADTSTAASALLHKYLRRPRTQ
jgi:predicted component of type VI protein secretion system